MKKNTGDKVLVLMPYLFRGGSEKQVRYIIEGFEKETIPVIAIIENGNENDEVTCKYINQHKGIKFVFFKANYDKKNQKTYGNKIRNIIYLLNWLAKNIKKEKIGFVMYTNLTGLITVPICKLMGCFVLFNERNPGVKMCNNVFKRILLKSCDKVVANSKSACQYMQCKLNISVECINNGIKPLTLNNKMKRKNKISILIPARINPIKNQMIIMKALNILKNEGTYECIFAGEIEDKKYFDELIKFRDEHNIQNEVVFKGFVSDMQVLYTEADLVILSSYEEGTPNVVLESYLNSKLCLASDIVMNKDIAVEQKTLFDVNDEKMLADKILWILHLDDNKKAELLKKQKNFVINNYGIEKMQNKYIDIYKSQLH